MSDMPKFTTDGNMQPFQLFDKLTFLEPWEFRSWNIGNHLGRYNYWHDVNNGAN